jgi:hypothetical protein
MYGVMQKIDSMDYEKIKLSSKTQLRLRKLFKLEDFDQIQLELFDSLIGLNKFNINQKRSNIRHRKCHIPLVFFFLL